MTSQNLPYETRTIMNKLKKGTGNPNSEPENYLFRSAFDNKIARLQN
jgi:hypothetical protein